MWVEDCFFLILFSWSRTYSFFSTFVFSVQNYDLLCEIYWIFFPSPLLIGSFFSFTDSFPILLNLETPLIHFSSVQETILEGSFGLLTHQRPKSLHGPLIATCFCNVQNPHVLWFNFPLCYSWVWQMPHFTFCFLLLDADVTEVL